MYILSSIQKSDLNIWYTCFDAYGAWSKCAVICEYDDSVIGKIDFSSNYYEKEINIDMIVVSEDYRRNGIATEMLNYLRNKFSDYYIDWRFTTPEGTKLKQALTTTEENPEYKRISYAIEKLDELIQQCNEKWSDDEWVENSSERERESLSHMGYKLRGKKSELEDELSDMREYITVWKGNGE